MEEGVQQQTEHDDRFVFAEFVDEEACKEWMGEKGVVVMVLCGKCLVACDRVLNSKRNMREKYDCCTRCECVCVCSLREVVLCQRVHIMLE